jgi:GH25 family lysozyme M1 (1,4-beta-N-acetylmuramidase)
MILGTDHYWRDWTVTDGMRFSPPDWKTSIENGSRFAFLKAADGVKASTYFPEAFESARSAGLLVGAYVWLDARRIADPKRQAEFWYETLKEIDCPLSIDFEAYKDNIPEWGDLYDAVYYYRKLDPTRRLGVYTNYYYWMAHGSTSPFFADLFNWSARYFSEPPKLYEPWMRTDIWQFSGSGDPDKYGITNGKLAVDEDWWMGDTQTLLEFFSQGAILPPPTKRTISISISKG